MPTPHVETPKSPYFQPEVVRLREEASALLRTQTEAYWKNWVSGAPLDVAATYQSHDQLLSPASVSVVRNARRSALGDEARALAAFELYLAGEILARTSAPVADQLAAIEAEGTLSTEAAPPYARLDQLLAGEASADQRARLYAAAAPVIDKLAPVAQQRRVVLEDEARQLGFASLAEYDGGLHDLDLDALNELAARTLVATQDLYARVMDKLALDELALPLSRVRASDVPRLFRSPPNDIPFGWPRVLPAAYGVFQGLGIDPEKQAGLHVDAIPAAVKNARAVCLSIAVPSDVRVSLKPRSGLEALRDALFALAQAEQAVHTTRTEWELRLLGPNSPTEAFAFLFQDLAGPVAGIVNSHDAAVLAVAHHQAAERLYLLRHDAGLLQFQIALDTGKLTEPPARAWRKIMSAADGFPLTEPDSRRWIIEDDPYLEASDPFVAWILAAQVQEYLTRSFGEHWWTSPAAGAQLRSLWTQGHRLTVDDVLGWIGAKQLDPTPLVSRLARQLESGT
jgi:hypothetical protein